MADKNGQGWEDPATAETPVERASLRPKEGEPIPFDLERPRFADVNHWHPVIDWDAYQASCTARAIGIKISQSGLVSRGATETVRQAEARGLVVIGYNYGAGMPDKFLEVFPPKAGRIPCLDFEGVTATVANAERFIRTIRQSWGRPPWFYGRREWLDVGAPKDTEVQLCPYWGPQYGIALQVPRGVGLPVAWQYTDGIVCPSGGPMSFPGIGPCDISSLFCSAEELRASAM